MEPVAIRIWGLGYSLTLPSGDGTQDGGGVMSVYALW